MKSKRISRILPALIVSLMLGFQLSASEVEKDSVVVADTNEVVKTVSIDGKQIETTTVRKDGKEEVHTSIVTDKGDTLKVKVVKLNASDGDADVSLSIADDEVSKALSEAFGDGWSDDDDYGKNMAVLIVLIVFGSIFGLPAIIIFLVFYFRHREKKRRYALAEQAIAAGQPIPEGLMGGGAYVPSGDGSPEGDDKRRLELLRNKGIRNIGVGIGLIILLWMLVDMSIASIGALVMCIGISQVVTYYLQNKK